MTRIFDQFQCKGETLACTIDIAPDTAPQNTGLLIVSGGNEIRSGAHAGQARLAQTISEAGYPVFRYDRRGIGESSGENLGFLQTEEDISAAVKQFHKSQPQLAKIIAFGNCDAATALVLFSKNIPFDGLVLANPWVIESTNQNDGPTTPPPSAIRARYLARLKNPQTIIDLFKGQINFRKLLGGLKQASQKQTNTGLAIQVRDALADTKMPTQILLAKRDTTALAFSAAWESQDYELVRNKLNISLDTIDSSSHSFANEISKAWLLNQIMTALRTA